MGYRQGGPDTLETRTTLCAGHHNPGVHTGIIEIGGFAPHQLPHQLTHQLTTRLGIHPETGQAFVCYQGERRVSEEIAQAALAAWRRTMRNRTQGKPDSET